MFEDRRNKEVRVEEHGREAAFVFDQSSEQRHRARSGRVRQWQSDKSRSYELKRREKDVGEEMGGDGEGEGHGRGGVSREWDVWVDWRDVGREEDQRRVNLWLKVVGEQGVEG